MDVKIGIIYVSTYTYIDCIYGHIDFKINGKSILRLLPLVFFRDEVVVKTGVDIAFRLISYFLNFSDLGKSVEFMERYQECESVIIVPPLQLKEGFLVLTHAVSFNQLEVDLQRSLKIIVKIVLDLAL